MLDLNSVPYVPAKYQRLLRRKGGSAGTKPDTPRLIVAHTMQSARSVGTALQNAAWQRDTGGYFVNGVWQSVSSHLAIDPETVIRCVLDDAVAFAAGTPWNDLCLHAELAGRAEQTAEEWADDLGGPLLELTAEAFADWCLTHGIPPIFVTGAQIAAQWETISGITTHYEITVASQTPKMRALGYKPGSHVDPGPAFPMLSLVERVKALVAGPHIPEDDEVPTEIKLVAADHTTFVWNPPTNTLRWVNDGNVDAIEPAVAFLKVYDATSVPPMTLPNTNSVDDGIRSLIVNTVKAGVAPTSGSFANAW